MKKLINKSLNTFFYKVNREKYILPVNSILEVPDEIAKIWLKYKGIEEVKEVKEEKVVKAKIKKSGK